MKKIINKQINKVNKYNYDNVKGDRNIVVTKSIDLILNTKQNMDLAMCAHTVFLR